MEAMIASGADLNSRDQAGRVAPRRAAHITEEKRPLDALLVPPWRTCETVTMSLAVLHAVFEVSDVFILIHTGRQGFRHLD